MILRRTLALSGMGLLLLQASVVAQVRLGVTLPRRSYVVGEAITATVTLQSQSPMPLVLGREHNTAELLLEITANYRGTTGQPQRRPVQRDMVLMPSTTVREVVEITSLYSFLAAGSYRVNAVMLYEDSSFYSASFVFDIVPGIEMRGLRQMVPGYRDIEVVYSFRYASREGREEAFMVIEGPDTRALYGTFSLGPLLRLYQPMIRSRADGSVVVVHQSGRNRYTRSIFMVHRTGAEFLEQRHFRPDGTPIAEERQELP